MSQCLSLLMVEIEMVHNGYPYSVYISCLSHLSWLGSNLKLRLLRLDLSRLCACETRFELSILWWTGVCECNVWVLLIEIRKCLR